MKARSEQLSAKAQDAIDRREMEDTITRLKTLVEETRKPESEVIALAFEAGVRQLWRGHVLGRYLRDEISRSDAITAVGIDWVELAERQHQAAQEDFAWAMQPP